MAEEKKKEDGARSGKLRLLIASDTFLPRWDGISRFLAEIIPRLKHKFDITVIAPDLGPTPAESSSHFRLVKLPLSSIKVGDFRFPKAKYSIIKKEVEGCDIVFTQTIGPIGMAVISAAEKQDKRVVAFVHSIEWELATMSVGIEFLKSQSFAISKGIVRNVYKKVDLLVFPSQSIAELFTWHQVGGDKEVIHLGVDTKRFSPPESKEVAKKKFLIDKDKFVIGSHGRIAREKDLMTLLRAFLIVKKRYPETILLIVGDGVPSIKKKLESVRGVMLQGATDNVVPYVQAMDLFCLTSLTETTSLTTLEAMACGVPVIANKVGFVKEYLKDGKNGLFFIGKDSYDLSKKIMSVIKDAELRKRLSVNGRKFTEKEFDWAITAEKLQETLERVAKER